VETGIAAPDTSNIRLRSKQACFPTVKTTSEFNLSASSIPAAAWTYLCSLEWIAAEENLTLIGPGPARVTPSSPSIPPRSTRGLNKVRCFTAAELVEKLYRGHADNSAGRPIEAVLRNHLIVCDEVGFAPLDSTGSQQLFRLVAAAYERRNVAIARHWPFEE